MRSPGGYPVMSGLTPDCREGPAAWHARGVLAIPAPEHPG